ncbi:MAG: molybdopterin converting factor subunit 1 [Nitrospinae bacterium]|nr:molybdopterin converting factor subunit 1 [Nitrospinota bacterium]
MVTIKLFAVYREKAKTDRIELDIKTDTAIKDLLEILKERTPSIKDLLTGGRGMIAVNQEIARLDTVVKDGDEVALIPPVSGGVLV